MEPEKLGWSSAKLAEARNFSKKIRSAAVMIVDDGVVVDAWGDIKQNYYCHSIRKSLLSALIVIHIEEGNIESNWPDIHNRVAEWNIWVDPVAASEVFSTGLSKGLTPLDATKKVIWKESDAASWEASGTPEGILAAELLRWMLRSWSPKGIFVWDLVAAVNATDPDLCQQEQVNVQVVTEPGDQQGRTVVDKSQPENTTACIKAKVKEVKKRVRQVFGLP
ncbi:MAG: nucleoside hydrolase [Deltaproteobacteria bacterium]|nr:MAG: nucleoside hydrolase [Deltaproteobacteria bacterium]